MTTQNDVVAVAISGHRPFPFDATREMYNVILIWHSPCAGDVRREMERGNTEPLEWDRACQWVSGIMKGIGKDWAGHHSKYVDAYMEPCTVPRPWTAEILNAFRRELARETLKGLDASMKAMPVENSEFVRAELAKVHEAMGWGTTAYIP